MNKVVLITGGSSGIGKSIGEYLHHKGFVVYGTSRNPERIQNSVFPLVALDVRNVDSIQAAVAKIIADSGRLDIVVNNAGVGITGPLEEIPTEEIKNNFETNFFGPIEVMKAVLPQMRAQKSGLIINVTSIAGYMGLPYRSVYSASKGALELITEALRMEVKSFGIQITNVAPGDVERPDAHDPLRSWAPIARQPLPFPALLVASHNDPFCSFARAQEMAQHWGARCVDAGDGGHLNADSGLGDWPQGKAWLDALINDLKD